MPIRIVLSDGQSSDKTIAPTFAQLSCLPPPAYGLGLSPPPRRSAPGRPTILQYPAHGFTFADTYLPYRPDRHPTLAAFLPIDFGTEVHLQIYICESTNSSRSVRSQFAPGDLLLGMFGTRINTRRCYRAVNSDRSELCHADCHR